MQVGVSDLDAHLASTPLMPSVAVVRNAVVLLTAFCPAHLRALSREIRLQLR